MDPLLEEGLDTFVIGGSFDGGDKAPVLIFPDEAYADIAGDLILNLEGLNLFEVKGEGAGVVEAFGVGGEEVEEGAIGDEDGLGVRGEEVEASADAGGITDAQDDGLILFGEGEGPAGILEAVIGEGLVGIGEGVDGEAGFPIQASQLKAQLVDGERVGFPWEGLLDEP